VIAGTVAVGDGPVGVDLIDAGANVLVVSTGFGDDTYTLTSWRRTKSGFHRDLPVPGGATDPGHAVFVRDDVSTKILITGNGSDNLVVFESGRQRALSAVSLGVRDAAGSRSSSCGSARSNRSPLQ